MSNRDASNTEANVFFKKLTSSEKQSKLAQLATGKENKVVVWKKAETVKYNLTAINFKRSKEEVEVIGKINSDLLDKDVLASFDIAGLHFFGKCKLINQINGKVCLEFKSDLFKSERRANFRLLTFPHQDVYIHIKIPEEKMQDSNLVSLRTKMSETGLFNNFLKIVGEGSHQEEKIAGFLKFRVIDISVTGLAIQVGELENQLIGDIEDDLGKMVLDFNGESVEIPNGQILYKTNLLARDKKTRVFKAGLKFSDIDTNLDEKLAQIINKALRSLESEFEDFLK